MRATDAAANTDPTPASRTFTVQASGGDPDSDSDGVPDSQDSCPHKAGPASNGGCPLPKPACSDGVDNDNDGKIDFPADPGCTSAADNNEADPVVADNAACEKAEAAVKKAKTKLKKATKKLKKAKKAGSKKKAKKKAKKKS